MSRALRIGIDPGQTGAVAVYYNGDILELFDMPVMGRAHGSGQEVNTVELGEWFESFKAWDDGNNLVHAFLEAVSAMPGQGSSGMFRFGESFGAVKGCLGALRIPYTLITPQRWKKAYGLIGKDKDAARTLAITRFPEMADRLKRKKDVGRADAILLAAFEAK